MVPDKFNKELTDYKITELQQGFKDVNGKLDKIHGSLDKINTFIEGYEERLKNSELVVEKTCRRVDTWEGRIWASIAGAVLALIAAIIALLSPSK